MCGGGDCGVGGGAVWGMWCVCRGGWGGDLGVGGRGWGCEGMVGNSGVRAVCGGCGVCVGGAEG